MIDKNIIELNNAIEHCLEITKKGKNIHRNKKHFQLASWLNELLQIKLKQNDKDILKRINDL